MRIVDIIEKKKLGKELESEEIEFLINSYLKGETPDYQVSAFLMAVVFRGMTPKETATLTKIMINSGKVLNLSQIPGTKVDKHSTGGVGDKTTLVIAPILASCGVSVAKMSGKGLGHTGGTIDKLESIPGFNSVLSEDAFIKQVSRHKIAIISQSTELALADKKLYALRDATGTVDVKSLIASSIMSKKIATGADAILLDVKCGQGAFMKDLDSARELARLMIEIGKELDVDVRAEITNMDRPIGREIGNKNEVLEAIKTLYGEGPADFTELVFSSCSIILRQAKIARSDKDARIRIQRVIDNGRALEKFYSFIKLQNGDVAKLKSQSFWVPKYKTEIRSVKKGFVNITNSHIFGSVAMKLGAGRLKIDDEIDYDAGITINKKTNEEVLPGDVMFTLYSSKPIRAELRRELSKAYEISKEPVENKIILESLE